ncbi:ParB N-terminal domain-containing protein [Desulfobacula phenolica]|uniref:Uncharacterized protein n=1 Tax=Desulfobacula phenolica TaxID=90732 RepID=A0A1H2DU42_9BACT|nr:hypothetical protein [Desulfobacula phenolica]SDT86331.1 hypothetical protein SAMN04487931_102188 [Desulfobacula phenolica]
MSSDNGLTQPTDLYPDLYEYIQRIILKEKIHVMISLLPYIPIEYIKRASEKLDGKLDVLSVFDGGVLNTILKFYKTNYYQIIKSKNQISFFSLCVYMIKFYRYSRYIKSLGFDLPLLFDEHQKYDPSNHLGKIVDYDVGKILSAKEFIAYDKDILMLFEKNFFSIVKGLKSTNYFRIQRTKRKMTLKQTLKWIHKYYKLYCSMKTDGYKIFNKGLNSYPWLFVSGKITMRIDGHHRCAVAKHLHIKTIPVLLVVPEDLKNRKDINSKFLEQLFEV